MGAKRIWAEVRVRGVSRLSRREAVGYGAAIELGQVSMASADEERVRRLMPAVLIVATAVPLLIMLIILFGR
jgi:hypothetical protein